VKKSNTILASLPLDAKRAGQSSRSHWAIENSAGWDDEVRAKLLFGG